MNAFARCIAHASPSGSTALILAEVGSQAELEAFRAIAPVLDSCVPTDASAQISRFDLRNHIASALYAMAFPPVAKEVATR